MSDARLKAMERTVIDRLIAQALSKARMGPRHAFKETLVRWLPSDPMRPDAIWVYLSLLRDDELLLLAEEGSRGLLR